MYWENSWVLLWLPRPMGASKVGHPNGSLKLFIKTNEEITLTRHFTLSWKHVWKWYKIPALEEKNKWRNQKGNGVLRCLLPVSPRPSFREWWPQRRTLAVVGQGWWGAQRHCPWRCSEGTSHLMNLSLWPLQSADPKGESKRTWASSKWTLWHAPSTHQAIILLHPEKKVQHILISWIV